MHAAAPSIKYNLGSPRRSISFLRSRQIRSQGGRRQPLASKDTGRQGSRQEGWQRGEQAGGRQAGRQRGRESGRQEGKQAGRQAGGTGEQTDGQAGRHEHSAKSSCFLMNEPIFAVD